MHRSLQRLGAPILGLALMLPGCAAPQTLPPGEARTAGSSCPGSDEFDVAVIRRENAEKAAERRELIGRLTSVTPLPPGAEEAETRIRVRVPDTAMWPWDTRLTLWKDGDGAWQIATNNIQYNLPPPPPHPPPPPLDEDGNPLYHWEPPPEPVEKPPYLTSALAADQAAELDRRLADPCFRAGPENFSYALVLRKPEKGGNRDWICPPDSAFYSAEVKMPGEATRYLSHACYLDFETSRFLRFTAYLTTTPAGDAE